MSGTMDKIKAKVDNVLHKDKTSDPTGPHNSHSANKADPRVDSDHVGTHGNTTGAGGVGAGQYGSSTHTGAHAGTHTGTHSHGTTGTHGPGLTGSHTTTHASDPTGPHDSRMMNKTDPRVDSDHVGGIGNTAGAGGHGVGQYGSSTTHTGTHGTHGTHTTHGTAGGLGGAHGTATHGSDPTGPHDSRMANKLDPRVDSDQYGAAGNTMGTAGGHGAGQYGSSTHTGTHTGAHTGTHTGAHTGTHGGVGTESYGSTTAGGLTGTHAAHGAHGAHGAHANVGSGNSNTTAGPHNSDMLNKIDPRVDSDLNGSKTVGGNATYR